MPKNPPITIDERGRAHVDGDALELAAGAIPRRHHLYLDGLFHGDLLTQILELVEGADFRPRRTAVGSVECIDEDAHREFLEQMVLMLDQRPLRDAVAHAFGVADLCAFSGTIVRRLPGQDHHSHWHSDVTRPELPRGRAVAMVINLSSRPFVGGNLVIRESEGERELAEVVYRKPGDAVLFAVTPRHEHRVNDVVGGGPRAVLTGWFHRPQVAMA